MPRANAAEIPEFDTHETQARTAKENLTRFCYHKGLLMETDCIQSSNIQRQKTWGQKGDTMRKEVETGRDALESLKRRWLLCISPKEAYLPAPLAASSSTVPICWPGRRLRCTSPSASEKSTCITPLPTPDSSSWGGGDDSTTH